MNIIDSYVSNMDAIARPVCAALLFLSFVAATQPLDTVEDDFDFDGLPGANHEFRFEVPAGKSECFFQKVKANAELHVSFEVCTNTTTAVVTICPYTGCCQHSSCKWQCRVILKCF